MQEKFDLTGTVAAYVAGVKAKQVPGGVAERTKLHILDTIGAMLSGSHLKPGRLIIECARRHGGHPEASVVASDLRTSAVQAALANGVLAHADETDDAHFPTVTHPGSVVVPAALAVGEREHCSGNDLITAVVLGYDIMCRTSKALDRPWMSQRGLHCGSISAGFGAAAAAGRLLRLSELQIRYAMAFAGTQACGLYTWRQDPEHIDKALCFSGVPARNGVTAALWAEAGLTATSAIFDGPDNLFKAFCDEPRPTELAHELGSRYEILDTSIKKYPAGQPVQATLEGYFRLVKEHGLKGSDIRDVLVRLPESQAETVNDRLMPDINCQYLLAVAMLDGKIDFESAHDFDRMRTANVLEMKKRVRLAADAELTRRHPAVRAAIVEIATSDGRHFEMLVDPLPGAPYNPLPAADVEAKFLSLSTPVLGETRARSVAERVSGLEDLSDIAALGALLRV